MNFTCVAAGFFLFACQSPDPVPDAARFCKVATLVQYSSKDTPETRRQLRAHNAKWRALCTPVAGN